MKRFSRSKAKALSHYLLTGLEIEHLAQLVAQHVADLADPGIVPPPASSYIAAAYRREFSEHTLTVEIDMGGFMLPLSASLRDTHVDSLVDVERLANAIAGQIATVSRSRSVIVDRLAEARAAASASAARAGGHVVDVRIALTGVGYPFPVEYFWLDADVGLLDDAMRLKVETLTARTPRVLQCMIARCRPAQRERLRRLKTLQEGEVLHVNAITEAAILHAGQSVGAVAARLLKAKRSDRWIELEITKGGDLVRVGLLDGLLAATAVFHDLGCLNHREVRIYYEFPESICRGLIGLDLGHVADHPILQCGARIDKVISDGFTDIAISSAERAVTAGEVRAGRRSLQN